MLPTFQQKRASAAVWTGLNPVLAAGEIGVEKGTPPKMKIGDGVTAWNTLKYATASSLTDLTDVESAYPTNKQVLTWSAVHNVWIPEDLAVDGVFRGAWATGVSYNLNDLVTHKGWVWAAATSSPYGEPRHNNYGKSQVVRVSDPITVPAGNFTATIPPDIREQDIVYHIVTNTTSAISEPSAPAPSTVAYSAGNHNSAGNYLNVFLTYVDSQALASTKKVEFGTVPECVYQYVHLRGVYDSVTFVTGSASTSSLTRAVPASPGYFSTSILFGSWSGVPNTVTSNVGTLVTQHTGPTRATALYVVEGDHESGTATLSASTAANGAALVINVEEIPDDMYLWTPVTRTEDNYHTHTWGEITRKPTTFPPSTHAHAWGEITGKPETFTPSAHTHTKSQVTDLGPQLPATGGTTGNILRWNGTAWVSDAPTPGDGGGSVPSTGNQTGDLLRWNGSVWIQTATKFHEGTGNPNGVVTAPVGSTFVNTESGGYNGARRWTKATGTGNTGWVVVDGDTGPRYLHTSDLSNGWEVASGRTLSFRRVNQTLFVINETALNGTAATAAIWLAPTVVGMRLQRGPSSQTVYLYGFRRAGTTTDLRAQYNYVSGNGTFATDIGYHTSGSLTLPTEPDWPTTLPYHGSQPT